MLSVIWKICLLLELQARVIIALLMSSVLEQQDR